MRHVDGRNPHELREASWIEVRRPQGVAHGLMAREAVAAFAAGNVMGHEHAVAHPHAVHGGPDLDNLCGNLVSQDEPLLRLPVPLQDVGAADAAGMDLDEDLSRSDS